MVAWGDQAGPVSFVVDLADGREQRCHQDHLRIRFVPTEAPTKSFEEIDVPVASTEATPAADAVPAASSEDDSGQGLPMQEAGPARTIESSEDTVPTEDVHTSPRYPKRDRKPFIPLNLRKW